ncbi:hypothetical protein FA15DRAFT_138006 [Coprinopsis marcescibilis]|uniref:Uncharacterized protein n=1 Tax=Coprinopsis marcescibilis TaxID=230819 RepID=A0A5C3KIW2_COPMA|nr:hypothetical protein FA15DRAFT_138006 [Coprinopsis marcescibilis]
MVNARVNSGGLLSTMSRDAAMLIVSPERSTPATTTIASLTTLKRAGNQTPSSLGYFTLWEVEAGDRKAGYKHALAPAWPQLYVSEPCVNYCTILSSFPALTIYLSFSQVQNAGFKHVDALEMGQSPLYLMLLRKMHETFRLQARIENTLSTIFILMTRAVHEAHSCLSH